ncbi:DegT/DnrJ/EryC1/StrS family aminotransferase [Streptomyces sp. NPDC051018]|uniref:DegT/DnrJ/EryC1/StrS family aminotransferase n=1 Tax=Streptomyces sp. NPDC051018 TaxID=3365639 RepID=UPI0037BE15B7
MINVFQPSLGQEELSAVAEVFADNWLGHGPRTGRFEAEFAAHLGVPAEQLIFISSGTAGLYLSTELLGLGPGDEVVMPTISFVSAGNAVAATGARPVFCDVDPHTLNPTAEHVERMLTDRTRAVLVLHYGGHPGDIAAIARLCEERGVPLIEDSACSVASRAGGRACGTFGALSVWSFDAMKLLSTGDGGMLYVADPELAARARRLAYHGLTHVSGLSAAQSARAAGTKDATAAETAEAMETEASAPLGSGVHGPGARVPVRWWELDVRDFGRRVVGNDLTAAIGSVQLRRLDGFLARRRAISAAYDRLLAGLDGVRLPPSPPAGHTSSPYFYWVQLAPGVRDAVASDLLERGIYTTFRYPPLHRVPAYGPCDQFLPGGEHASDTTLLLPLHQGLDNADVLRVATEFRASVEARRPVRAGDAA